MTAEEECHYSEVLNISDVHTRPIYSFCFAQQENGTSVKKEEHTPSKRSPSNGVASTGEALTLVNGVS